MKNLFSITLAALLSYTLCFALELEEIKVREGEHQPFVKEMKYKTEKEGKIIVNSNLFRGKIASLSGPGRESGSKYTITVIGEKDIQMDFTFVPGLVMVTDYKLNILKLKDLKVKDEVTVEYMLQKNGEYKALSITLE